MKVRFTTTDLPFQYPFTISKGTKTSQPALVVELEHFGIPGYGEAPAISYYNISAEQMVADLKAKKLFVEKFAFTEPDRYWHYLHHLLPGNPFLVCALDMAAWDMYGKMKGKPLHQLWGLDTAISPATDYTIGIDSIENMVAKMKAHPWPIYKIKVGSSDDVDLVEALRTHTSAVFRVDANAGWSLEEALAKIPRLKELGVEFVEQPLARDNWEGMKTLFEQSSLPLFADESCVFESDVAKCAGYFHGVNIKLTKCSGPTPALRMIAAAKQLGLQVMVGSMNESTIGTAAIAHLAPALHHVDADGPLLLSKDIATGLAYSDGVVRPSGKPGLGIEVQDELVFS